METQLSEREQQIYKFFAQSGNTVKEAAEHFGLSPDTIKSHLQNIYLKLHIGSKVELVRHYFLNKSEDAENG